ncbi:MAG: hypothetical protein UH084_08075 [Paludibacteraceae bacterium]|nr:hypothetical protein [Paludibacteraceae bacterium]
MFYHIDFPIQQKDPESAWQRQLARERAKQEEREAKILALIDATIQRFAQNDTRDYVLNPSDKEYYIRRAKLYTDITAKLGELDPVKDYSEINGIGHKRQCIRQDFRQLMEKTNKFSKKLINS